MRTLQAVLPILSRRDLQRALRDLRRDERAARFDDDSLAAEHAIAYEAARGGVDEDEVIERMRGIATFMRAAVEQGLAGTEYGDRMLPAQSPGFTGPRRRAGWSPPTSTTGSSATSPRSWR